jgi:hypothetical protein
MMNRRRLGGVEGPAPLYARSVAGDAGHYDVLGVDPSASMAEIKQSYLRLARDAHPDRHNSSEPERLRAEERMRRLNAAWAVIGDVDQRAAYDRQRLRGETARPRAASAEGAVDDPDPWRPFDPDDDPGFDEQDDRPITDSALPSWLKTGPALGVLFGIALVLVGSLIGVATVFELGAILVVVSLLLFAAAPLVALSLSRSQDRRP